jgi:precorrin-2 dehydrogenase/sirohydrochlorin ferrochelatase
MQSMSYLPIALEMARRRCLVIGGGMVAERKIASLLEVGAEVTVISPAVTETISSWSKHNSIQLKLRCYQSGDVAGYQLVFVATDDDAVSDRIYREGRDCGAWVNAADDPARCDFIMPAVLRRGELVVAVSTGGTSPAVTRVIREELENYFTADYERLVRIAGDVRRELSEKSIMVNPAVWNQALRGEFRRLVKGEQTIEAKKLLLKALGAQS